MMIGRIWVSTVMLGILAVAGVSEVIYYYMFGRLPFNVNGVNAALAGLSAGVLIDHFSGRASLSNFLFSPIFMVLGMIWYFSFLDRAEVIFSDIITVLVFYSVMLFICLSEWTKILFGRFLTIWRGERWVRELDYLYLGLGALGIVSSLNRIQLVNGRNAKYDIIGPLILASALVIRTIKTRAEIGGWNKLEFYSPAASRPDVAP